jgi:hypothetical protein
LCETIDSFSLQETVAGVLGEESLASVIETSNKKAIGTKRKRSSKKGKVSIQESSSESDKEIEFESAHSGDDISDEGAECLFCTGLFSHDKHGEKWAVCVRCYRWAHEDCGIEEDYVVCPICKKKCKIVSYITKYLLSHIRTPFLF